MDEETEEADVKDGDRVTIGGMVAGKTVKTTRSNQLMAFIKLEDLVGSVEVLVFPKIYESNREILIEDAKLFVQGRVSLGDEPVGKLVGEKIIPFDSIPRELWLQFPDKETYQAGEQRLLSALKNSEGTDQVIIYLQKERAKKALPPAWRVKASNALVGELGTFLGEKNVKLVEKGLKT